MPRPFFSVWPGGSRSGRTALALQFTTPVGGIDATPSTPHIPEELTATIDLPNITATTKFVLKVDPEFADTGQGAVIFYDSSMTCPLAATGPCDSTVSLPVLRTTVVALEHFRARADRGRVVLDWRTASETDVLGFNVWRQTTGPEQKANRQLVPASGRADGASYRLVDRTARWSMSYTYRLQIVHRNGTHSWYGSVRVRPAR
jgi:hypothetical protein